MNDATARAVLAQALDNLPAFACPLVDEASALREIQMTCETAVAAPHPRLYQVETTSACNLSCAFCPRTFDLRKGTGKRSTSQVMPLGMFERVLDMAPQTRSLEVFHFGEPFTHPDFHTYIQACTKRGIFSVVASNMALSTPAKLDAAFEAGLGLLVMDLDSLDPVRYAGIRVGALLDEVRANVLNALCHVKRRPYLVIQSIRLDGKTEFTPEEFRVWSKGAMPDEFRFRFLDSFRGNVTVKQGLQPHEVCRDPFYGCAVQANGNVVPCLHDWAGDAVMGNVYDESLDAIWTGRRFRAFRDMMRSPEKPAMCRSCGEGQLVNLRSQPAIQVNMFMGKEVCHAVVPAS